MSASARDDWHERRIEEEQRVHMASRRRGRVSKMFYALSIAVVLPLGTALIVGPVANINLVIQGEAEMRREIVSGGLLGLTVLSACGALIRLLIAGNPATTERIRVVLEIVRCIAVGFAVPLLIGSALVLVALTLGSATKDSPISVLLVHGAWTTGLLAGAGVITAAMLALFGTSDLPARRRLRLDEERQML